MRNQASGSIRSTIANQTLVFVRGADGALWERDSAPSSPWQSLGGQITGGPAGISLFDAYQSNWQVFARGTDGAVWTITSTDGSTWSGWSSLGGVTTDSPVAVGSWDLFVRGTDGALWQRTPSTDWQSFGGQMVGGPGAMNNGTSGVVTAWATGLDHHIWATRGSGWIQIPVGVTSSPPSADVDNWSTDHFLLFVLGTDNAI